MRKALVLVFSNLSHDARVLRQITALRKKFAVTVCCYDAAPTDEYSIVRIKNGLNMGRKAIAGSLLLLRRFSWAHRILYPYEKLIRQELHGQHFDLIVANDVETLPIAFNLKADGTKVIFDAHEYAPRHFEDRLGWRIFFKRFNTYLCQKYVPQVDGMITISKTIADEYEKEFGKRSVVIMNCGPYVDLQPRKTDSTKVRLVHHGIVNRSRRIELIIGMMRYLPENFSLDLYLVVTTLASGSTVDYLKELRQMAASDPRIRFLDPVPVNRIVGVLHGYDMGIILAPPVNFNYRSGIPNKLFDYIQARIATVTGPSLEIARIVKETGVGVVAKGFTSSEMAKALEGLDRIRLEEFKQNADRAARDMNAGKNEAIFHALLDDVFRR